MRNRIDKLGVAEPEIRKQGSDEIVIQLAGVTDPEKAAELIGKTAQLELFDLEQDLIGPSIGAQGAVATSRLFDLLGGKGGSAPDDASAYYLFGKNGRRARGTGEHAARRCSRGSTRACPEGGKVLGVPNGAVVVSCAPTEEQACPPDLTSGGPYYYLFRYQPDNAENPIPEMTGAPHQGRRHAPRLRPVRPADRVDGVHGRGREPLPGHHAAALAARQLPRRRRSTSRSCSTARSSRGRRSTRPTARSRTASPAARRRSRTSERSARRRTSRSCCRPVRCPSPSSRSSSTDVSATLGKDSLQEAKTAALIGLLLVALFLIVFYRLLGLVAVTGLAIYVAFMYAAILILNVTLTLPGFAGLILTIGVAADANVVIFERIKEEVRAGKSTRAAIATGYQKGFHTIVDANVVTAITALVLFAVATAQVKGFALMLLIGTVMSVLTAVVATRAMLGLLGGFRWFDNPRFMGAEGQGIREVAADRRQQPRAAPNLALDRDGGDRAQRARRRS